MPILGSFGTANERAYGFGDSSVFDYTVIPPIIENNAALLYDASNVASYSGTGTTWYDLSGNNRHGTFNTAPTVIGTDGNKAIVLPDTGAVTLTIPSVYTASCAITYVMVIKIPSGSFEKVFDGLGWKSNSTSGYFFFGADLEGSGGFGTTTTHSPIPSSVGNYAMVYSNINLNGSSTSSNTWLNNDTGYVEHGTSSFSNYGGNSGAIVGKVGVSVEIKMIALYERSAAPTQLQAYNALKTRFGL